MTLVQFTNIGVNKCTLADVPDCTSGVQTSGEGVDSRSLTSFSSARGRLPAFLLHWQGGVVEPPHPIMSRASCLVNYTFSERSVCFDWYCFCSNPIRHSKTMPNVYLPISLLSFDDKHFYEFKCGANTYSVKCNGCS